MIATLPGRSQSELLEIEMYERHNADRVGVLNKLRKLRPPEPIHGYDEMRTGEVVAALKRLKAPTLERIREYERQVRDRREIVLELKRLDRERDSAAAGD